MNVVPELAAASGMRLAIVSPPKPFCADSTAPWRSK